MTRLLLRHPHTHAGTTYPAGAQIDVDASTADWLISRGIAIPTVAADEAAEVLPKPSLRKEPKP